MKIGSHNLSKDGTYVIAEIGSNHNQDKNLAFETIDAAIDSGANAVKFQSLNIDKLYFNPSAKIIELHKKIDLEESWHYELKSYCDKKGIDFFSSPTYLSAVDMLEEIGVSLYKLASAQVGTFPQLVKKVIALGKPVIFSTGIVDLSEISKVIDIFHKYKNNNFILLHCNSIYPTPFEKINLNRIFIYKSLFQNPVGFSDHSSGIYAPIAAVAQGAQVIEKHFTIDANLPTPDAALSLEPKDFKEMVFGIRVAEKASGMADRENIEKEEQEFKARIIYRLVLSKDVKQKEYIKESDFNFLRHSDGINCCELNYLISKNYQYSQNLKAGALLNKEHIEV